MRSFTLISLCLASATGSRLHTVVTGRGPMRASAMARPASRSPVCVMGPRTMLIAGNWKMNTVLPEAIELAKAVRAASEGSKANVAVCVPFPFLESVGKVLAGSKVALGAQDCSEVDKGAFTGAVSTSMLKSVGSHYILTGHSERRAIFGESDELINKKTLKVLSAGLKAILCVGELKEQREDGSTDKVVAAQLAANLKGVSEAQLENVVIAYEPVWAIGTGLTATPEQAQDTHKAIRGWIAKHYSAKAADQMTIQYGGSVTPETVDELMACPDIDGALVGGASLVADKFARIVNFK